MTNKVRLVIYYARSMATDQTSPLCLIQKTDLTANQCAENLVKLDTTAFVFGDAIVYTAGILSMVFEDVDD